MALGEERATGDRPPVPSHGLVPPPLLHADACFPVGLGRLPFYRRLCLASIILQLIKIGVYLLHPRRAPALSTTGPGSDFGGIPAPHITGDARGMRPLWSAAERCRGGAFGHRSRFGGDDANNRSRSFVPSLWASKSEPFGSATWPPATVSRVLYIGPPLTPHPAAPGAGMSGGTSTSLSGGLNCWEGRQRGEEGGAVDRGVAGRSGGSNLGLLGGLLVGLLPGLVLLFGQLGRLLLFLGRHNVLKIEGEKKREHTTETET